MNNKILVLSLLLITFSYTTIESLDNSQQASIDFKQQENVRLRNENLLFRSFLGIHAEGIRTYHDRVLPKWELNNSYDLINIALREERNELEMAKAKANHQNSRESSNGWPTFAQSAGIVVVAGGAFTAGWYVHAASQKTAEEIATKAVEKVVTKSTEDAEKKAVEENSYLSTINNGIKLVTAYFTFNKK